MGGKIDCRRCLKSDLMDVQLENVSSNVEKPDNLNRNCSIQQNFNQIIEVQKDLVKKSRIIEKLSNSKIKSMDDFQYTDEDQLNNSTKSKSPEFIINQVLIDEKNNPYASSSYKKIPKLEIINEATIESKESNIKSSKLSSIKHINSLAVKNQNKDNPSNNINTLSTNNRKKTSSNLVEDVISYSRLSDNYQIDNNTKINLISKYITIDNECICLYRMEDKSLLNDSKEENKSRLTLSIDQSDCIRFHIKDIKIFKTEKKDNTFKIYFYSYENSNQLLSDEFDSNLSSIQNCSIKKDIPATRQLNLLSSNKINLINLVMNILNNFV